MKNEDLKKIISQIKKYDLKEVFNSPEELEGWLSKLSKKQVQNFNSLNIEPDIIKFPKHLLINDNLLNCNDYTNRVDIMTKLKIGDDCLWLLDNLCSSNFLNSKKYYKDMEMLSKVKNIKYPLCVISDDNFIHSKYHDKDLKLIIEAKDIEKKDDELVAEALVGVAKNADSIKSLYHQKDMELIAKSGSSCLQSVCAYPESSLNNLAVNEISLNDKYHFENMQILSKNVNISHLLYKMMTDLDIIRRKYYREEIEALLNANREVIALAIYYHITNPSKFCRSAFFDGILDYYDISLLNRDKSVKGNLNPNYLRNLKILNIIDDKYVMYFESLLSNKDSIDSGYQDYDLEILLSISNKDMFMDLYQLMMDKNSLFGPYHIKDVQLISKTEDIKIRKLLLRKALDYDSIHSIYHDYDMNYIAKLDLDSIEDERYKMMEYYLFNRDGIVDKNHIDNLEKLYKGEIIDSKNAVVKYLDNLEEELNNEDKDKKIKGKVLSQIRKIFNNK